MQLALIADTHGFLDPRIAAAIKGVDVIVHAGDVGDGIAAEISDLAERIVIVQGNNDPADSGWPALDTLELPGGRLAVMHGHQWPAKRRHAKLRERFEAARAIVCGHSHRRLVEADTAPAVLNPGAAGKSRAYGGRGYMQLTIEAEAWQLGCHVFESGDTERSTVIEHRSI